MVSEQIGAILAGGTNGNPRQIKRFLNSLLLRQRTAEARGFGDEVKVPVLAKLMLAERFLPRLFDQIATDAAKHSKGICENLAILEEASEEKAEIITPPVASSNIQPKPDSVKYGEKTTKTETAAKAGESPILTEWLSSPPVRNWTQVQPPLADVDLRPYLFIAKDRKDYFGAASVLGHLVSVVERLLGPKLTVQAMETELKQLAPLEATQVFDALRSRVMAADTLETEPAGVAGFEVLVRAHPDLQANLLDFLEALPSDRCGAWAVTGWGSVIRDSEMSKRFSDLLNTWSTSAKNTFLKVAANSVLRIPRGNR